MNEKTRKLTLMAMLGALAYLVMLIGRIPVVLFLSYDPKDIVIAIGAFLLGPLSGAAISLTVTNSTSDTSSEIPAPANGPSRKPPMAMTMSFGS